MRHLIKVRGDVLPDVDRLLSESTAELCDIRDGGMIKGPKRVFVERFNPFSQANFYAIRQQVILTEQILLLNPSKKFRVIGFPDGHYPSP